MSSGCELVLLAALSIDPLPLAPGHGEAFMLASLRRVSLCPQHHWACEGVLLLCPQQHWACEGAMLPSTPSSQGTMACLSPAAQPAYSVGCGLGKAPGALRRVLAVTLRRVDSGRPGWPQLGRSTRPIRAGSTTALGVYRQACRRAPAQWAANSTGPRTPPCRPSGPLLRSP